MEKQDKSTSGVPITKILKLLMPGERLRLLLAVSFRVLANFLDLAALAGVGLLAVSVSQLSVPAQSRTGITLPILGSLVLSEQASLIVAGLVAGLFLTKSLVAVLFNNWIGHFTATLEIKAGKRILETLVSAYGRDFSNSNTVSTIQNLIINSLNALFTTSLLAGIASLSEMTLLGILLTGFLLINPLATVSMGVYLLAVAWILHKYISKRIQKEAAHAYKAAEGSLTRIKSLYGILPEVRLYGSGTTWVREISNSQSSFILSAVKTTHLSSLPRYLVETSLIVGIFGFVGGVVLFSDIPSQAVTLGVFLTGGLRIVASLLPLQSAVTTLKQNSVKGLESYTFLRKIQELAQSSTHAESSESNSIGTSAIELEAVTLRVDGKEILQNLNLRVARGIKYAIVGPSGAGKTSLVEVAIGLRSPSSGRVFFGGREVSLDSPIEPGMVGYVPQSPRLIAGTLLENITLELGLPADDARLWDSLAKAGLNPVIDNLPEGVFTQVEPDFTSLSGGEIQRVGLARALYRNPSVLVLDEATSALDADTEAAVTNALDTLRGHVTQIVIAHRLSTIKNADRILYLDDGKLVDEGTFEDLLRRNPGFARTANLMSL